MEPNAWVAAQDEDVPVLGAASENVDAPHLNLAGGCDFPGVGGLGEVNDPDPIIPPGDERQVAPNRDVVCREGEPPSRRVERVLRGEGTNLNRVCRIGGIKDTQEPPGALCEVLIRHQDQVSTSGRHGTMEVSLIAPEGERLDPSTDEGGAGGIRDVEEGQASIPVGEVRDRPILAGPDVVVLHTGVHAATEGGRARRRSTIRAGRQARIEEGRVAEGQAAMATDRPLADQGRIGGIGHVHNLEVTGGCSQLWPEDLAHLDGEEDVGFAASLIEVEVVHGTRAEVREMQGVGRVGDIEEVESSYSLGITRLIRMREKDPVEERRGDAGDLDVICLCTWVRGDAGHQRGPRGVGDVHHPDPRCRTKSADVREVPVGPYIGVRGSQT